MEPFIDWWTLLGILGALQGIILSIVLWTAIRPQKLPLRFMSLSILSASLNNLGSLLFYSHYIFEVPHLARVHTPLMFCISVGYYFYVKSYLNPAFRFRKTDWLNFLPILFCSLWLTPIYLQSASEKILYLHRQFSGISLERYLTAGAGLLHAAIYMVLILKELQKKSVSSTPVPPGQIKWLRWLTASWILILTFGIFRVVFDFSYNTSFMMPMLYFLMAYALGYVALWEPAFLYGITPVTSPKYHRSTLTQEKNQVYRQRLEAWMDTHKPYLRTDLTLYSLAEQIEITPHHLSQIINECFETNFFDFVNAYRIKEAQVCLLDPANDIYTIQAIGQMVGFNTKSTFNAAFKKHTGLTPSAYKKQLICPNL